jgi:hypothetical protein
MAIKKAQNGTVAKDKTVVKKTVMKKQELAQKPTYKNLSMAVDVDERATPSRGSRTPNKQDSLDYASGFKKGLNRKKDLFENTVSRSGRWEGENTSKKFIKAKRNGGPISKAKNGKSFPDLNKDGKVTRADILKGRGVIAKNGKPVKKAAIGALLPLAMKALPMLGGMLGGKGKGKSGDRKSVV